jgi:hypothetical protein
MIELEIQTLSKLGFRHNQVIEFEGDYDGKFIIQSDKEGNVLRWKPILFFDGWEPVRKIKDVDILEKIDLSLST